MRIETLSFETVHGETTAYVAMPEAASKNTKAVILIQEWWGLNDHIKDIADRYAKEGFIAIAPDLYRGKLATNTEEAAEMMANLAIEDGLNTIKNVIAKARETYGNLRFGISGYCMGGTYALRASCEIEGISAAAPFYGDIPAEDILRNLKVPVIFISGTKDEWINPEKVSELESGAAKYNLSVDSVKYDADHAFFNNTRPEVYDEESAKDAWKKVIEFFNKKL